MNFHSSEPDGNDPEAESTMKGRLSSLFNRVTAVNTTGSSPVPAKTTEEWLEAVEDDHRSALLSMYNGLPQRGSDGQLHEIDRLTRISPE